MPYPAAPCSNALLAARMKCEHWTSLSRAGRPQSRPKCTRATKINNGGKRPRPGAAAAAGAIGLIQPGQSPASSKPAWAKPGPVRLGPGNLPSRACCGSPGSAGPRYACKDMPWLGVHTDGMQDMPWLGVHTDGMQDMPWFGVHTDGMQDMPWLGVHTDGMRDMPWHSSSPAALDALSMQSGGTRRRAAGRGRGCRARGPGPLAGPPPG